MDKRPFPNGPQDMRSFAVEDHGELAVLRLGPRGPQNATHLEQTRSLSESLRRGSLHNKKVLLIKASPGSLSPRSIDEFWRHIRSRVDIAREENAFRYFLKSVRQSDSFVIAVVQGECDFSVLGPLLACDYRIAAEDAMFVNRLFRSKSTVGTLTWFLTRYLGQAEATDILLEGRSLTAREAYELKLVNKLAVPGDLEAVSLNTARRFARIPTQTLRALKRSLVASMDEDFDTYLHQIGAGFEYVSGPPTSDR